MLLSISVLRKPSPVTTYYINTTFDISSIELNESTIYGLNPIKTFAKKCLDLDSACHKYFSVTGKSIVINW